MKNIAIIGASYLQLPLILKAKEMGLVTHVFAWKANDVGEKEADYFYPISIVEKDEILNKCKEIGIDGICSIASDLASITVNYVAQNLGLVSNSLECTKKSTNKHYMRKCFEENGDPSPKSLLVETIKDIDLSQISFPLIVKPVDRSGSRGISKVLNIDELEKAIDYAKKQGFEKKVLVEEYVEGDEYSVECLSWKGEHHLLQITKKYTTGSPSFIETGHFEPALLEDDIKERIKEIIFCALDSLEVEYGASHSEIKIDENGNIKIIEIGARMGGDLIGSNLVKLTTGIDFVENVIRICMNEKPILDIQDHYSYAGVRFIFNNDDLDVLNVIKSENKDILLEYSFDGKIYESVSDSSSRHGYYLLASNDIEKINKYMPKER